MKHLTSFSNKFISISLIFLFVVSCGGGGGGGGSPAPEPSPTSSLSSSSSSVLIDTPVTLTWSSTNATSCTATGTWSGTKATSGSEDVTISTPGNNQFTITCSGAGGSRAASVTVEGYRNTEGVSVDGYIRQADIFIDTNDSYTADSGEDTTTSDNEGKFTIKYSDGNLISLGGTDLDSGNALDNLLIVHKLTGHSNFKAVTPVTSVAAFMADASLVNVVLGIDASLDIATVDPVAGKGDGGINDYLYEKGNQLTVLAYALQNITNNLNTTTDTTQDYYKAIAEELDTEYAATETRVNIETEAFITKVIDNIITAKTLTVAEEARTNLIAALASVMPVIEVKSSDTLSTAVFDFATSTLQTDAQALANGTATAEIISSYQSDVLNYIATDQDVDADELAPEITAIADEATLDEDGNVDVSPLNNDSYLTSAPISVAAANGASGVTSVSNNIVTYSPDADFNGSDAFDYTITQGDKTSSANVAITVNAVNDAPTFDNLLSTYSVAENQTAITTVAGSDVEDDALSIALSGTDAASFNLSSLNVLTFVEAPDYEEDKKTYSITLSVSDDSETTSKDITILVTNVNDIAPVISSAATFSAAENQTTIGSVTATDAEGDSLTYTVSGSELFISPTGSLFFRSLPDYETKSSYTATVTVNDGVNDTTQAITVSVTNVNDIAPVISSNATFSAAENQTAIGSVVATDAEGDPLTYLVSGSELAISSTGVLTFVSAPDYETKSSYIATVIVNDGLYSESQVITVSVTNVNDIAPVISSSATFSAAENQTAIGSVIATDAEGDPLTYTVSGSELAISSSGVLTFVAAPDYETKSAYTATLTVNDGVNDTTQAITVEVANIREDLIDWTYKITNGTDDAAPRLQATVQFDDLLNVDKVIFRLRMDHEFNTHGINSFVATKTATNTWTIDEPLSPKLNPAHPYYMNIFYESGSNGSNFPALSSRPKEGSNWQFLQASTAQRVGALTLEDSLRLDSESNLAYLKFTNTSANVDTTAPSLQSYLSASDPTSYIDNPSDAIVISGNDGDVNTPITISVKMLFNEKILYATERMQTYSSSGYTLIYNNAETLVNGREVTYTWTLSAKTAVDQIKPYIYVYDEALNRTRIRIGDRTNGYRIDITNSIADTNPPSISSITFDTSVGSDKEKYIDYEIQLESLDELTRLSNSFRGPHCELIYGSFHDYNIDSSLNPGQYKGKLRLLDNQVDGIYTTNAQSYLIAYDADNNVLRIDNDTLKDIFSVEVPMILDADPNQANNLYCPIFPRYSNTEDFYAAIGWNIYGEFSENSTDPVLSYENIIQDPYGNIITPKFGLMDHDAALFNISDTGVLTFKNPPDYENPLDHDGDNSYEVGVKIYSTNGDSNYVADSSNWRAQAWKIDVQNLNDENTNWDEYQGSILDPDLNNFTFDDSFQSGHNFSIYLNSSLVGITDVSISGPDADWFSGYYDGARIILTFLKNPDCNVKTSLDIILTISNGTSAKAENITINFNKTHLPDCNVPELYWQSSFQDSASWPEINNYFYQTVTNYITDADGDINGTKLASSLLDDIKNAVSASEASISYSISGEDASRFVAAESSVGNFCDGCNHNYADYEYKPIYNLTVSASDGTNTISKEVQINVENKNDNLTIFSSPTSYQFSGSNQKIGTIVFSDKDWPSNPPAADACNGYACYSLSIENENDAANFYLDGNDLYFAGTPTKGGYSIKLIVDNYYPYFYNSGNTVADYNLRYAIHNLSIDNTDINSAPTITSSGTISADENQTFIGTVVGTDYESSSLTYTLSGTDAVDLNISSTGVLSFKTAPDYETKNSYSATVSVSDGENITSQDITIGINNILEDVIAYSAAITNGTMTTAPKFTASITLDELTMAKKVYTRISSVATSGGIDCGGQKTFEMTKTNATLWEVSQNMNYQLKEICKYQTVFYISPFDITEEASPPEEGKHLRSRNKGLGLGLNNLDSDLDANSLQHTFKYQPIQITDKDNLISITNPRSDNSIDTDTSGDHFRLYHFSEVYPSACTTGSSMLPDFTSTPVTAVFNQACLQAMLINTSTDSNKVKYEFSIYSYDRLESASASFFGSRKDPDLWGGPNGYGYSSTELEVKIATIDSSDDRIATFTFEFDEEFLPHPESNYIYSQIEVYPITKALASIQNAGSTSTGYYPIQSVALETSSNADTVAPEVISIDFEPYQNGIYPQRDYLKATATITNNSSNGSSLTSVKDLFMSMISPDCSRQTMYLRDELDGKIDPNTETISATFPILKNNLGTYHLINFNINDWGFAERVYLYKESLLGSFFDDPYYAGLIQTHPDIGKTITIGDGTTPTCPLFDNYKNDYRWSEYITVDENTSVIGTFSASGALNDTITYSLDSESIDDFYQRLTINSATGELSSNTPFDADSPDGQGGYVTVIAQSSLDTSIKNRLNLDVTIRNLDDEAPSFTSVTDADLCDITGIQSSRTCSIADGTSLINGGQLMNPDGSDDDSILSIGGADADLVEATESTSAFATWNIALKSNADISQKDQYQFTLIFSTTSSDTKTRTEDITLNVTN